ncbi:MAG TPA: hypothetical protein VFY79_01445 [Dehalococcoidia bacterium]|nr:hypothetical protein [Dehalococcoidia bacterium]
MAQKFRDDDAGYRQWLNKHPNGFVLNAQRSPNHGYLMLHRSNCGTISNEPANGELWTKDYIKVCAASRADVSGWLDEQPELRGASPAECRICLG